MTESTNETSKNPEFTPQTDLDHVMWQGRTDPNMEQVPLKIIEAFLNEKRVFFLSPNPVNQSTAEQKVEPLTLAGKNEEPVIAIFTHITHVPQEYLAITPHAVGVPGGAVVTSLKNGGIIINPGTPVAFEISAKGVESIRNDFLSDKPAEN
ncbi:SseB family protein [Micrococcoides hystricis]|uniref:SseB family protein n=1 Tax=Micrococcoides hystricis TaxID=1572761 RepID=A0ABV6PCU7_9MICC